MVSKYKDETYGVCPRGCDAAMMPYGMSDVPGEGSTTVYCGVCKEIYRPANPVLAAIDGAYFGSTFSHLFFMEFGEKLQLPELRDTTRVVASLLEDASMEETANRDHHHPPYYVPKIFGYKVSSSVRDREIQDAIRGGWNNKL
ncbi:casein kinase II beta subunit [Gregarina niphandrodes]|uniref:Casein kinase II subunit beta n=1 Tax=Gregarina niphandrodes TaxID=110365 RepID=A0A023B278_GRENI|nr:casein kinase II beta subunit [Gregarina niphandrodes]EZG51582.1 casein kinase II beta subunit [Gregarina niphandrodes]|eukprot:XP_011131942.1 casein kinase II beta subunit [Gregarina niphandrodes]